MPGDRHLAVETHVGVRPEGAEDTVDECVQCERKRCLLVRLEGESAKTTDSQRKLSCRVNDRQPRPLTMAIRA